MKFTDLDLKPLILAGLRDMQYVELTPFTQFPPPKEKINPYAFNNNNSIRE